MDNLGTAFPFIGLWVLKPLCVEVRGIRGLQGLDSGSQGWGQAPSPAESSHWLQSRNLKEPAPWHSLGVAPHAWVVNATGVSVQLTGAAPRLLLFLLWLALPPSLDSNSYSQALTSSRSFLFQNHRLYTGLCPSLHHSDPLAFLSLHPSPSSPGL